MEISEEIENIRKDLDVLIRLFSKLIDKIVPEEEPEKEDREAIEEEGKIVGEKEIFNALK